MNAYMQIRMPKEMKDEFQRIAKENAQNPSQLIRNWIEKYIEENKEDVKMPIVTAPYTGEKIEVLPRKEIEKIIFSLDPEEVVRTAYSAYVPGMKTGYAGIDLVTGELKGVSLGVGEENTGRDALWVSLYSIGANIEFRDEDIYYPEEIEEYETSGKADDMTLEEYYALDDNELKERKIDALVHYFEWDYVGIENQLNGWYKEEN